MLIKNQTPKRCLVLSVNPQVVTTISSACKSLNILFDFKKDRKSAIACFLQHRHLLLVVDAQFLPRFPYRLMQLFKIAHREPAVLILNDSNRVLTGFERLEGCCIRVLPPPVNSGEIVPALSEAVNVMGQIVQAVFMKNLFVQICVVLPLLLGVVVVLYYYFVR